MVIAVIILLGYLLQSIAAFLQASHHQLVQKIFSPGHFIDTWGIIAMIFFVPFIVSLTSNFIELINSGSGQLLPTVVLSMLLIYITLEFSQLGSLNKNNKEWSKLLVVAIALDISSIVLVTAVKVNSVDTPVFIYSLAIFAFLSSFMIILFSYVSGKSYE